MAIALDAVTNNNNTTGTSLTYSHTNGSGSDRMLFVGCSTFGGDYCSWVTYGWVSMVQIGKIKAGNWSAYVYLYALYAPATWANNVVVSSSSSTTIYSMATSYTWANQSNTMDASNTSSIASASLNFSTNLTTTADNCWSICYTINDTNVFASSSDTRRGTNVGWNIFDSNGAITPAGSKTMTQTVSGSGNGGVVMASFAPSVSPTFIPRIIIS